MHRFALGFGLTLGALAGAPHLAAAQAQAQGAAMTAQAAPAQTPQTPPAAKAVVDQGVATAKANNKVVFVHVGASWCGWCHRLDAMLKSPDAGAAMSKYYVIVPLDALEEENKKSLENPGVDSVMKALDFKGGPPMFAFLDGEGKKIASSFAMAPNNGNIGYPATSEEISTFGALLKKTAPAMTDADYQTIIGYLTKNSPKQ
jgi:thiol-disulfide isomerase/thioredoxin